MSRYAAETQVSVEKSKAEIDAILRRYGATGFIQGWDQTQAVIGFMMNGKQVKFILPLPSQTAKEFTHSSRGMRSAGVAYGFWEQACRQRWRALALVIKAKLEAVAAGITVFEDEFLAHIVLPDGRTVGQLLKPQIERAYSDGNMPPLLPNYSGEA